MIWMSNPDKLRNYFSQPWLAFTEPPIEAELGTGWAEGVHPEGLGRCFTYGGFRPQGILQDGVSPATIRRGVSVGF